MKNTKKLLSFILSFALIFAALPICLPTATASAATYEKATTVLDFETEAGWSGSNGASLLSWMEDPDDSSNHVMRMSSYNNAGYNMELADGPKSTTAYQLKASTSYTISFEYKLVEGFAAGARIVLYIGTAAGHDPAQPKHALKQENLEGNTNYDSWNTVSYTFTTKANQYYNEYVTSSSYTNVVDKLYLVYAAGESNTTDRSYIYIDNVVIKNNDVQTKYTTYDFTNNTGISNLGYSGSYTTDPHDSNEKVVKIKSTQNNGGTIELAANGSKTDKPFQTLPNTSYTISFNYKLAEGSHDQSEIYLYLGSQYDYDPNEGKYQLKYVDLVGTTDYTTWNTFTYTLQTTENMYRKDYAGGSSTSVFDKLYISLSSGVSGDSSTVGYIYIDNVVITNNSYPEKYTIYNFNNKTGISTMPSASTGYADYVTDPYDSSNICVLSTSVAYSGATIELADSGNSTANPYTLLPDTSYTVSFKYRVKEGSHSGKSINLYVGDQFSYDSTKPKYCLNSVDLSGLTDYENWQTYSYSFTTPANLYHKEFQGSGSGTYVCDKLYISASIGVGGDTSTGGSMYIDDVVIINNDIEGAAPDTTSYYEINDFTHTPYAEAVYGADTSDRRVSGRMYSTTDGDNSVLAYQYSLHPEHITEGFSSSGEGTRGNFMGTNGLTISSSNLVTSDGTVAAIQQGSAYKISFKYKVTSVESNSYIGFTVVRGLYSAGQSSSPDVGTAGSIIFRAEHAATEDWKEVYYTFLADYPSDLDKIYLKLGMVGYGTCLVDDIKVEAIDASEVEPLPDTSSYSFTTSSGEATITAYNGTATALQIPEFFNGAMLTEIGNGSFIHSDTVESIVIPGGVATVGSYAFEKAYALKTVSIPSTVTSIGDRVFYDTPNLTDITVHSANESYVSVDGVLYNKDMTVLVAYPSAKTDTSFTVPSTVTQIAPAAFQGAVNLTDIELPSGLTAIGESAFRGCSGLTEMTIPSTVTEIGSSAFRNCVELATVDMGDTVNIGSNAFYGCSSFYTAGNVDSNSAVDAADALKLVKALAGRSDATLNYSEQLAADVNRDGNLDMLDSAILQRHLAERPGYEELPSTGRKTETYDTYESTGSNPELVLNLTNTTGDYIVSDRDINYDESKEDIIMILVIGQSNNTTGVGYGTEYNKYVAAYGEAPTAPVRPDEGTVYSSSSAITELTSARDTYYLCDAETKKTATHGGSTPALGKALHDATGAKVVFIQTARGATGMHEWVKDPENYTCTCSENGNGVLYSNAVRNYLKSYYALSEQYNVISTGYYWNQGEHEEVYAKGNNTIHDVQSYYDAYLSMHTTLMEDCELDFGSIFMPRSFYKYNRDWSNSIAGTDAEIEFDNAERSRATTVARQAMYRIANDLPDLFVATNYAETMKYGDDDISNRIHYAQKTYNAIGEQAAKTILSRLDITSTPEFTGITVYNSQGILLATFDKDGNLTSGSRTVDITNADNLKLHFAIEPLGTYYSYDIGYANVSDFSSDFFEIDADSLSAGGYTSFDIVINTPAK